MDVDNRSLFKRKNGTYYIGGHESLPKPLTREEEAITIKAFHGR